jgi:hypothetical protein
VSSTICRLLWLLRAHSGFYYEALIRGLVIPANHRFNGSHCCDSWSLRGGRVSGVYESALRWKKPKVCVMIVYSVAVVILVSVLVIVKFKNSQSQKFINEDGWRWMRM